MHESVLTSLFISSIDSVCVAIPKFLSGVLSDRNTIKNQNGQELQKIDTVI